MRRFTMVNHNFVKYDVKNITLPVRATKHSVCYDFYSPIDEVVKPGETRLIFTNVKAYFNTDEALILAVTSGMAKRGVILANGIGIIECDYADNESNDGNLGFMLHNNSENDYIVNRGDKIGQGFFIKYLTVDDEEEITTVRKGGFGSTDKNVAQKQTKETTKTSTKTNTSALKKSTKKSSVKPTAKKTTKNK